MAVSTVTIILLHVLIKVVADNPLVPGVGMADPHIHVFEDKAFLYAGRDLNPKTKHFDMPDWNVWSSDDLIHWHHENTIFPNETYIGDKDKCWAVDVGFKNGKYHFYFSNGGTNLGVMSASVPTLADAVDIYKQPLVSLPGDGGMFITNISGRGTYDPTFLMDDDETAYLCFGVNGNSGAIVSSYAIAKLSDNLTSFAEAPRKIVIHPRPKDGSLMPSEDKSTLHKHNGVYYLSAGSFYATSTSVYGPYIFRGNTNPHAAVSEDRSFGDTRQGHGRFWSWNNQWFHVWCEFVSQNNTGKVNKDYTRWRDSWMTYTHYRSNGEMVDDWNYLNLHENVGVGQYDASWTQIEAEWFMKSNMTEKIQINSKASDVSFAVRFDGNGSTITFPNVAGVSKATTLTLNFVELGSRVNGIIEVTDLKRTSKLARCSIPEHVSGRVTCKFISHSQVEGILFTYYTDIPSTSVTLDWWSLSNHI